uniref:Uncharacterized protein n=1 Tax=Vespula pensylvanica TaxID=30213 RepID=A0A834UGU9_VESPE|nr:hypothetical protein H0235_001492 [Vespula pensylvanica]
MPSSTIGTCESFTGMRCKFSTETLISVDLVAALLVVTYSRFEYLLLRRLAKVVGCRCGVAELPDLRRRNKLYVDTLNRIIASSLSP